MPLRDARQASRLRMLSSFSVSVSMGGVIPLEPLAPQPVLSSNHSMRPDLLNPLFADVTALKGVGDKVAKLFQKVLGRGAAPARVVDLLVRLPVALVDRRYRCTINQLPEQGIVTVEVVVGRHHPPPQGKANLPYRIDVYDDTGEMTLVYFKAYADSMKRLLPEGEKRFVSGEISWFRADAQMNHPDHVVTAEGFADLPALEPVYPLTAGLSGKAYMKAMALALPRLPHLPEWQDVTWLRQNGWKSFHECLTAAHVPHAPDAVDHMHPTRQRLAYDELLANQLALAMVRRHMKRTSGRVLNGNGTLRVKILAALPYRMTGAQESSVAEIANDMASGQRMIRLLQGDVGAGKTLVAVMALAIAVEAGSQGALMVPTEILARQHFSSIGKIAAMVGLRVGLLTGREKGRAREETLAALAAGKIDILIGTHALFQDGVVFDDLGLVVIDEQHRFGVHQRLALQGKAKQSPDVLVMTATPIPRTLALTAYGDMDVSRLLEKPPGRLPIETRVMPLSRMDDIVDGLARSMAQGVRTYWVCPLVEESELVDLAAAEERFTHLVTAFPGKVGLIHGRLKGLERDKVMDDFKSGALSVLVSTTVIEVGVDVPEAAIMVIENAERFGLAQLHQLRGRVGRGSAKSHCILLYQEPLGENGKARLEIMRSTEDGFVIAEEDLRLRGAGEVLGTQQSGLPEFKMADLTLDAELLAAARDDAALILNKDDRLQTPRGEALRHLLYLFERDEAIRLLSAG
jgi:ATP-dependent DNA helicase RecG